METITLLTTEGNTLIEKHTDGSQIIKAQVESYTDVSDGYHTIEELYDHRITLFIALCRSVFKNPMDAAKHEALRFGAAFVEPISLVWRSMTHGDDKPAYEGWFIMGIGMESGSQISYHLPISRWDETDFAVTLAKAPVWDGHTSADVLARLKNI